MAKPRIFVSSTYYDLKYIRNNIENFIREMGYESILFESGDIPFKNNLTLAESCYKEIENSDMQVLIIGGKYGSPDPKTPNKEKTSKDEMFLIYNSITKREFETALGKGIPIYIFVEKQVLAEYDTYKNNRENETIQYAHVDNINIFKLLDDIYSQRTGNYVKGFEKADDITSWLRDQWAGLFADYLKSKQSNIEIETLSTRINELKTIADTLKKYIESLMREIQPDDFESLINKEDEKIELEKAYNLSREPLISFLIHKGYLEDSPKQIYNAFKSATNFIDFLDKMKVNYEYDNSVKGSYLAELEFNTLKVRYQNIRSD